MAAAATDQERLTDYWVRRDRLSEREWADFYVGVRAALLRCPAPELSGLPDRRESYIDEFFAEKIFFSASRAAAAGIRSISGGALCGFFRRYLVDLLRGYKTNPLAEEAAIELLHDDATIRDDEVALQEFLGRIGGREALTNQARKFLGTLDAWAMLMLRGHFCADDDGLPMATLCKGIASYHYKAQKLGITVKKGSPEMLGYEHTLIGRWIEAQGVKIAPENLSIILFLLGLLCLEAVAMAEGVSS